MKKKQASLAHALGSYGDDQHMGDVDLFGLDAFGQVAGMNPLWGAGIGALMGTGTAIAVRQLLKPAPGAAANPALAFSELIGLGAGVVTGGIMYAFPGTRAAGLTAMAVAAISNGLRALEQQLATATVVQDNSGKVITNPGTSAPGAGAGSNPQAGWNLGIVTPQVVPTLGEVVPQVIPSLGQAHKAGIQLIGPPSLAGMDGGFAQHPGAAQVKLLGGPPLSELSRHFGSTMFSPGQ